MWFRKKRIYADAAAATPLSPAARNELMRLLDVYGNAGALHAEGVEAKSELERARGVVAAAIGAHADEIVFTASGTESNNLALQGLLRPYLRAGETVHVITSAIEHSSVLGVLRALTQEGLLLTELPVDSEGLVSPKELAEAITDDTVLVSIQYVNSEIGVVEPIRDLAKAIRHARKLRKESEVDIPLLFHTDASQAPLWLDIQVESLGVDLLTLDAQKVMGPKGVGALYIKRGVELEPVFLGSSQERGLRGGTENIPLIGSFAVALSEAQADAERVAENTAQVRAHLFSEIKRRIPDVIVHGPRIAQDNGAHDSRIANNVNFSIPGLNAEMAVIGLDAEGVATSTRSACNTGDESPSHVIQAIGVPKELLKTAVRITLLPDATKQDAHAIAVALEKIAKRYKTAV